MTKTINYIDCPHDWIGTDDYSSHLPMLWLALNKTDGHSVVELGSGNGSTKMLVKECKEQRRNFQSYESNVVYAAKFGSIVTKISNYMDLLLWKPNVLFIDSAPGEQRKDLVDKYRDTADVIILHDTEEGAQDIYGIREVLNSFKYRLNYYPEGNPGTTALSNKINVIEWI